MKRFILALGLVFAPLLATPAFGQPVTATLPVTCPPSGVNCVQSTPVVNPDGTTVGGGGAYTGPAASQLPATLGAKTGAASLSVVPNTDTAFPISAASLPLPTGAATSALQTTTNTNLTTINTTLGSPFQAGGVIGALPAGSAIIGKVGIDQTTPGTTNLVYVTDGSGIANSLTVDCAGVACATASAQATMVANQTATGTSAQTAQGATANGASFTANPLGMGCYGSSAIPTAVTTGQLARSWCFNNGQAAFALVDTVGTAVTMSGTTTDGSAGVSLAVSTKTFGYLWNGTTNDRARSVQGSDGTGLGVAAVAIVPQASANGGVVPGATSAVASSIVAKASAGNVYRVAITTGGTAGYVMGFNATSAPADGAVTPIMCRVIAANSTLSISFADMPSYWSTGITFVFSSTGCFTKTASATAYIEYSVK